MLCLLTDPTTSSVPRGTSPLARVSVRKLHPARPRRGIRLQSARCGMAIAVPGNTGTEALSWLWIARGTYVQGPIVVRCVGREGQSSTPRTPASGDCDHLRLIRGLGCSGARRLESDTAEPATVRRRRNRLRSGLNRRTAREVAEGVAANSPEAGYQGDTVVLDRLGCLRSRSAAGA